MYKFLSKSKETKAVHKLLDISEKKMLERFFKTVTFTKLFLFQKVVLNCHLV